MWFLDFFSNLVCHSWSVPMMKITGLSHLFKWENLHNMWLTKYFFAPLYIPHVAFHKARFWVRDCSIYICYPLAALSETTTLIFTATQTIHNFTFLCHQSIFSSMDQLLDCISDLNTWMAHNFFQLNQDKTEVLIVGAKAHRWSSRTFEFLGNKDITPG